MDKKQTKHLFGLLSVIIILLWLIATLKVFGLLYIALDGLLFRIVIIILGIAMFWLLHLIWKIIKKVLE